MRAATIISLLSILAGCASPSSDLAIAETFFPFADRPTEEIMLQHNIQIVNGEVFHFLEDGSRAIHHFSPVATITDRNTYVISVSSVLDVADFMSGGFDAEDDVNAVIGAAVTYCKQTGYVRVDKGVNIWIGAKSSALVEFCVPDGVQLPPYYNVGDRVPRGE